MRVINTSQNSTASGNTGGSGGGGFKKGGFKSSFSAVKGPPAPTPPVKKNVLGDEDDEDDSTIMTKQTTSRQLPAQPASSLTARGDQAESDTDEEYLNDPTGGGYYDPRKPTGCFAGCAGAHSAML